MQFARRFTGYSVISQTHSESLQSPHVLTKSDLKGICESFYKDDSKVDEPDELKESFVNQRVAPDFKVKVRDVDMLWTFFLSLYLWDLTIFSSCPWQDWTFCFFPRTEL